MVLGITTFFILRACLKGAKLDGIDILGDVSLGDLTGNWLASAGEPLGSAALQSASQWMQRLDGPGGILMTQDDLAAAERRALGTVLTAFHLQLSDQLSSLSPDERQWHLILGDLAKDIKADTAAGKEACARLHGHLQSSLGAQSVSALLQPGGNQPGTTVAGDVESALASRIHTACLEWLETEVQRPVTTRAEAARPVCPEVLRRWFLDVAGFGYRATQRGDWLRRLVRRPPVGRPWLQATFLQLWASHYLEEIKATPHAFNQHVLATLAALKSTHPQHSAALEAAMQRVETAVTTALGGIHQQLASLLGLSTEQFTQITTQGTQAHDLLTTLITGQAEQSAAWQQVSQKLDEILSHLKEEHGPPIDDFSDLIESSAQGADIGLGELVYRRRWLPDLLSREAEMQSMLDFLNTDAPFSIHVLVGEAGMGKSRLALELVLKAKEEGWRAGFLRSGAHLRDYTQLDKWCPTVSTLLVIDYASEQDIELARALAHMSAQERVFMGRLRVLLVDRPDALANHLNDASIGSPISQDRGKEKVRQRLFRRHGRQDIGIYSEQQDACCLACVQEDEWEPFLRAVFARAGREEHVLPDKWRGHVECAAGGGRPLMLTVLGLLYLRQDVNPAIHASTDELLDEIIGAEVRDRWLRVLRKHARLGGRTAEELLATLQRFIALVILCRGFSLTRHWVRLRKEIGFGTEDDRVLHKSAKELLGTRTGEDGEVFLRPLEPDLLAERFLLRGGYVPPVEVGEQSHAPPFTIEEIIAPAMEMDSSGVVATLALIFRDYRESCPAFICLLLPRLRDDLGMCDASGGWLHYEDITHPVGGIWQIAAASWLDGGCLDNMSTAPIKALVEWASRSHVARYACWVGAVYAADFFRQNGLKMQYLLWDAQVFQSLQGQALVMEMPREEACIAAEHAVNAIAVYGMSGFWLDLERWGEYLRSVAAKHPNHEEIQLTLARGLFNTVNEYCRARQWENLERWGVHLQTTAGSNPRHAGVQFEFAKGACNAICGYGEAYDLISLEKWAEHLRAVATAFPDHADIQLRFANGIFGAISAYGAIQNWEVLERWGNLSLAHAAEHLDDDDIQSRAAKSICNMLNFYGDAQRFDDLERWSAQIFSMVVTGPGHENVQIEFALGMITVFRVLGVAECWDSLECWALKAQAVAIAHPENEEMQNVFAQGLINVLTSYGTARKWERMEYWAIQIKAVAESIASNIHVQVTLAQAAVNSMLIYGLAYDWPALERWGERLLELSAKFPEHAKIQVELARGVFNAIRAYGSAQQWSMLEQWGRRLQAVAAKNPENAEVFLTVAQGAFNAVVAYGAAQDWENQERWAAYLAASLPSKLNSQEQAEFVQQIFDLMRAIQQRDKQPALQAVIDLMQQRYVAAQDLECDESQTMSPAQIVALYDSLPEDARALLDFEFTAQGISINQLRSA